MLMHSIQESLQVSKDFFYFLNGSIVYLRLEKKTGAERPGT